MYRQSFATPLLTRVSGTLCAIDPESGAKLWAIPFRDRVERVAQVGTHLFLVCGRARDGRPSRVMVVDTVTGKLLVSVDAGIYVNTIAVRDEKIFLGGTGGVVAMGVDGRVLWRVTTEGISEHSSLAHAGDLVARDSQRNELWRASDVPFGDTGWLIVGDVVVQPDLEG